MTLEPGERFGAYEIGSRLGSGAMGEVFRARDLRLGRDVALKLLPERFRDDPERRRRFEAEALALSALNHPNVVTVYGAETHGDLAFIAMELVEGRTLRSFLSDGPLPPKKALDVAGQAAAGLAAAHARGLVHRDVKPENLVIGPGGRVKVVDFGIARHTQPAAGGGPKDPTIPVVAHLTEAGAVIGTVGYMSPEQADGREADFRSDQFSLGSVLHEMLSGRAPFRRDSAGATLAAILRDDPPPLPALPGGIAGPVAWIVERCLEKDPADRYGSTVDLAHDLANARDLAGHNSRPEIPAVPLPAARPRRLGTLARGFLVLLPFLFGGALWLGTRLARPAGQAFHKMTFRRGTIGAARFASTDGATVVYSAAWDAQDWRVYRSRVESPDATPLPFGEAGFLGFSPRGKLALSLRPRPDAAGAWLGTLAEAQLEGETTRSLTEEVLAADFAPDGVQLAVSRVEGGTCRLEYPSGRKLYETAGWCGSVRVSRDGSRVAFVDHPSRHFDDGAVSVVDASGRPRPLTDILAGVQGLAWNTSGDGLWFAATDARGARAVHEVDLNGKVRRSIQFLGSPRVHDVSRDGRLLISRETPWIGIVLRFRDGREEDVSWLDSSLLADLSADGKTILFTEYGESSGGLNHVYVRPSDGGPAVRLGEGVAKALAPGGAWALATLAGEKPGEKPRLVAFPRAAGERKLFPVAAVEQIHWATWLPDGKNLLLAANEKDRPVRLWVEQSETGALRPVSEEGITVTLPGVALSLEGRRVAAIGPEGAIQILDLSGTEKPRTLPGLEPGAFSPVDFSADGGTLWAYEFLTLPARLWRIDLPSGRRSLEAELAPRDRAGLWSIPAVHVSADGSVAAYSYTRTLSELYVVDGLK